jgi:hypothetical protein
MDVAITFIPGLEPVAMAWTVLRTRLAVVKDREGGYTTETIVITALLVLLGIAAVGILYKNVTGSASHINTDPPANFGS